ncbi:arylsulfatase B [Rhipicephalus sanguineus]|uniref:arylsulfatase B n=1 Tax=Rhipicephalus sanguineus TaxID=34632 RepID=UPI0020C20B1E|nr:arylsulfatase B [Rhipicephalus sanguineus]
MDALASMSVVLNNYYVQQECTPSRASLMTGLFPIHHGLHYPLMPASTSGLPLQMKLLPEHLKDLGYETHMVGKWHLGYSSFNATPTRRGFDSFYGYLNGFNDYYQHLLEYGDHKGLDFWNNTEPLPLEDDTYATTRFAERARSIIRNRDKSKPMFLYLAEQATHSAYSPVSLQAPDANVEKFTYIGDQNRAIYAGMVDALDQSIGSLMEALEEAGMLSNTLLVFSADNGALPYGPGQNYGFNWPLRGTKLSLWEGSLRAAAFVWSPLLDNSPRVSTDLMHVSDWLPTLYSAAGGDIEGLGNIDGVDMWQALHMVGLSPRTELLHDIDADAGTAAIRYEDYKLVVGSYGDPWDGRYEVHSFPTFVLTATNVLTEKCPQVIGSSGPQRDLDEMQAESRTARVLSRFYHDPRLVERGSSEWRREATVDCGRDASTTNFASGEPSYLYNLKEDPCELHNLANESSKMVSFLLEKLSAYRESARPEIVGDVDERGYPEKHNGVWAPWE